MEIKGMGKSKKTKTEVAVSSTPPAVPAGHKLLMAITNSGFAGAVIENANRAGASGATILSARGSADNDQKFLGMNITPEKEIVMIIVRAEIADAVMKSITEQNGLSTPAHGIVFAVPVTHFTRMNTHHETTPETPK